MTTSYFSFCSCLHLQCYSLHVSGHDVTWQQKQWEQHREVWSTATTTDHDLLKRKKKRQKKTPGSWGWTRGSHPDHDFLAMQRSWPLMFECSNMTLFVLSKSPFRLLPIIPEPWTLLWDKRVVSNCTEKFTVPLWRAFHFSGCDEILCSHFNSQHHIIGHHLGLSFLFFCSMSFSSVSLRPPLPHVLHMHVFMVGNQTSVVNA